MKICNTNLLVYVNKKIEKKNEIPLGINTYVVYDAETVVHQF